MVISQTQSVEHQSSWRDWQRFFEAGKAIRQDETASESHGVLAPSLAWAASMRYFRKTPTCNVICPKTTICVCDGLLLAHEGYLHPPPGISTNGFRRQHPLQQSPYHFGTMLSRCSVKHVGTFKGVRAMNLHLPLIIGLRAQNRDPPVSCPVTQDVFDHRGEFRVRCRIAGISNVDGNCHNHSLPCQATQDALWRPRPTRAGSPPQEAKNRELTPCDWCHIFLNPGMSIFDWGFSELGQGLAEAIKRG